MLDGADHQVTTGVGESVTEERMVVGLGPAAGEDDLAGLRADGGGNFKLPLLFVIMLMPLVFHGAGRISLDRLLLTLSGRGNPMESRSGDLPTAGLALLVLGLATVWVEPVWGITLLIASALAILVPAIRGNS